MICKAKSAHRAEPQISEPAILLPGWKRALDLTFCLVALPVLAIATLGVVVLTSLASPGPVFFRQERIGWRGRKFQLYKFRTMHVSSNVTAHQTHFSELMRANTPMQKLDARGDKRVIPGGSLLRASGLDELPQLINVLRGEMSLVGPRPSLPYECEQYAPHHRRRLECVPGLTGLWQVSGKNRTTFEEMVQLDVEYVSRRSVALDLKIMARTLPVVLGQVVESRRARNPSRARAIRRNPVPLPTRSS